MKRQSFENKWIVLRHLGWLLYFRPQRDVFRWLPKYFNSVTSGWIVTVLSYVVGNER